MKEIKEQAWKMFLQHHWKIFAAIITICILAVIGAVLLFIWFVGEAQAIGLVPMILNLWTMGHVITFLVQLLLRLGFFIGLPLLIVAILFYVVWWKQLPDVERKQYKKANLFGKSSKSRDSGGFIWFLVNIFFIIKVYMDGNWSEPFANWTFDYLVYSYVVALIWVGVIFAIPASIGGLWWVYSKIKK